MCGIAGFIDTYLEEAQARKTLDRMLETIAHRGPDNTGTYHREAVHLGHQRLSIIDLSAEAHQPFFYDHLVLTFNGEVYNYIEVKAELETEGYHFRTNSDTEVIAVAYKHWGNGCVDHFMGMWAFAIWDTEKQELFCSRDRFGIKPFYFINSGNTFYFASEIKSLKECPHFTNTPNYQQIYRYLQLGWTMYDPETFYESIEALPAAHNLVFKNGKVDIHRYWDISTVQYPVQDEEAVARFQNLFEDSVNLHMRADTPVGGCLSGGIDSSALCSTVGHYYPKVDFNTFTIYYTGEGAVDERPFAQSVIKKYDSLRWHTYSPKSNEIAEDFERFLYHFDVPPAGSSPLSQYFVMKLANQQGMKVLLDGQGADEYLAGYDHSIYRLLAGKIAGFNLSGWLNEQKAFIKDKHKGKASTLALMTKTAASLFMNEQSLYSYEYQRYLAFLPDTRATPLLLREKEEGSKLNRFLYQLTFRSSLPSLLHNEDRNSMAFSIESRVPFLDHRLVEYSFSLPDDLKYRQGLSKYILRRAMAPVMPKKVTERRDKKGFVTPGESLWLRGSLSPYMSKINFKNLDFLNHKRLSDVFKSYEAGSDKNSKLVWRVTMLNHWLEKNA